MCWCGEREELLDAVSERREQPLVVNDQPFWLLCMHQRSCYRKGRLVALLMFQSPPFLRSTLHEACGQCHSALHVQMPACAQAISNVLLCCPTPSDYPHCRVSTQKDQNLRMDFAVRAMKSHVCMLGSESRQATNSFRLS